MTEEQSITRHEEIEIRSEEVQELLGQIPHWIIRWGMTAIFLTLVVVLVGSWFFQYPDMLVSSIVVTTTHPPAAIVARTDGKIDHLLVDDQQPVKHGDVVASIENTAVYDDVAHLKTELEALRKHLLSGNTALPETFRADYRLGVLQTSYANFLTRYEEYRQIVRQSYVQKKIAALDQQIQHYHALAERSARQKDLLQQELDLSQRQYERYRHLNEQALVSQKDLETLHSMVLQKTYALEASKLDLTHQSDEQNKELRLAFDEAYKTLTGQITAWEHANLLTAPIDGTVTFTDYWSANQNVKTGDVVMTVVPDGSSHLRGNVQLPVQGAGKVKAGQYMNIKFANYPFREYGMVKGIVERISLVPSDHFYVVEVSFPEGFTTTYGNTLPFTQEMQGTAEIITENRRLLERFIQPIQALINQHIR